MILMRFRAKALYRYLDFDVVFNERLSFLTGINGSGKTSVLNCVQALLTPDFGALQGQLYEELRLDFEISESKRSFITAIQSDDSVRLLAGGVEAPFEYKKYMPDPELPSFRQVEGELEHYRDLMATSTSHPLVAFISTLPTPMFLGLDRRARFAADDRRPGLTYRPRVTVRKRLPRSFLGTSLNEAEDLAVDAYRDAQIVAAGVGEDLQRQLILDLLTPLQDERSHLTTPTSAEKQTLTRVKDDLALFPAIFHLPAAEVNKRVGPFLQNLEKLMQKLPADVDVQREFGATKTLPSYVDSLVRRNAAKSQLKRISVISQTVQTYNDRRASASKAFVTYKNLVNGFLKDSGKEIDIGPDSRNITVRIKGNEQAENLSALSSGESQIFVILTNLAFGPLSNSANVFITDEPELSLHLRWQELFVDSVLAANANTQFIMATHSPSIILERTKDCVEVFGKRRRQRRA